MNLSIQQQSLVEQRLANEKKSTLLAYVLWFFLGGLGIHRFYLGKTGSAVAMLLLFIIGCMTTVFYIGFLLLLVYGIWWIVDAFLIPGITTAHINKRRAELVTEVAATTQG